MVIIERTAVEELRWRSSTFRSVGGTIAVVQKERNKISDKWKWKILVASRPSSDFSICYL